MDAAPVTFFRMDVTSMMICASSCSGALAVVTMLQRIHTVSLAASDKLSVTVSEPETSCASQCALSGSQCTQWSMYACTHVELHEPMVHVTCLQCYVLQDGIEKPFLKVAERGGVHTDPLLLRLCRPRVCATCASPQRYQGLGIFVSAGERGVHSGLQHQDLELLESRACHHQEQALTAHRQRHPTHIHSCSLPNPPSHINSCGWPDLPSAAPLETQNSWQCQASVSALQKFLFLGRLRESQVLLFCLKDLGCARQHILSCRDLGCRDLGCARQHILRDLGCARQHLPVACGAWP